MHDTGCKCSAFGVGVPLKHHNTSDETRGLVLGCHAQEARINGLFDLLMNGIYWVHNPLTNPFPNFQQDILLHPNSHDQLKRSEMACRVSFD